MDCFVLRAGGRDVNFVRGRNGPLMMMRSCPGLMRVVGNDIRMFSGGDGPLIYDVDDQLDHHKTFTNHSLQSIVD